MSGGNWKELFNAGCEGDLALVQYHVESGVDINYAHPEFLSTPLVAAILAGQEAVALYLLDQGAMPQLPSEFDGVTPVQAARQAGLRVVEDRLCALGAPRPAPPVEPKGWWRRLLGSGRA
jgi:ankyrin repeat protein